MKAFTKRIVCLCTLMVLMACCLAPSTNVSAKGRTGFYVGGENNVRRVAIKKISSKKVVFDMAYAADREAGASNIKVKLKKGKGFFSFKDDWGTSGKGKIKIVSKKAIKIKTTGDSFCSTGGKWKKLKWVSSSTNVWTVY